MDVRANSIDDLWDAVRACAARSNAQPPAAMCVRDAGGRWQPAAHLPREQQDFLSLYLPLCAAREGEPLTFAHLGQSLDGCVATVTGDSFFVNDRENIVHLHRLRALSDAVVVGGATAHVDDPRLTTRLVRGDNPARVVVDPRLELDPGLRLFTDGAAPTLLVCLEGATARRRAPGRAVERLEVPADAAGRPDLAHLLAALHARGWHAVFVEGGGVTVSRFLEAGLLDRLQIAVAPMFIGAGRAGLRVAARRVLADCLRPSHRVFRMGADLLYDCDLRASPPPDSAQPRPPHRV